MTTLFFRIQAPKLQSGIGYQEADGLPTSTGWRGDNHRGLKRKWRDYDGEMQTIFLSTRTALR